MSSFKIYGIKRSARRKEIKGASIVLIKPHKIDSPTSLDIFHLGPENKTPLPALFYFSLSAFDSLALDPFNQPAIVAYEKGMRVFSFTLPGHGPGLKNQDAMQVWAESLKKGEDPLKTFLDSALKNVRFLEKEGYIDPEKMAIAGLSRGAMAGFKLSLLDERFKTVLGFAPLIDFNYMDGDVKYRYSLFSDIECFIGKRVMCYIGNLDTRVGTDVAFDFIKKIASLSLEKGVKSPPAELVIKPSIGFKGHGTSFETFREGIDWLYKNLE